MKKIFPLLSEIVSILGILSSFVYATYIYWVFGGTVLGFKYVAIVNTPADAMTEVGRFATVSVLYIAIQVLAVYMRRTTSVTSQALDAMASFAPLFTLWSHMEQIKPGSSVLGVLWDAVAMNSVTLEQWVFSIAGLTTLTDAVLISFIIFHLAFLANDWFQTR